MVLASFRFVPGALFLLSRGSEPERGGGDSDDGHPCLKIDLPLPRDLPLFHDDDDDVHSDDGRPCLKIDILLPRDLFHGDDDDVDSDDDLLVSRWTSSQRSTSSIVIRITALGWPCFQFLA